MRLFLHPSSCTDVRELFVPWSGPTRSYFSHSSNWLSCYSVSQPTTDQKQRTNERQVLTMTKVTGDRLERRWKTYTRITACPYWYGSVGRALSCRLNGRWFDSWLQHMPGLWVRSPVRGMQEQPIDVFLPLFLSSFSFL